MQSYNKLGILYFTIVGTFVVSQCPKSSFAQNRNIDPEIQKKIDDFIQDTYLPASGVFGLGLTIVQNDGKVLYTTGYGLADKEREIPVGNSTQFAVGSITKGFTSVVGAKLLHERFPAMGEAVLDTPIRRLFPELNFTLIDRFRSEYTNFRDLVSHRMCLVPTNIHVFAEALNSTEEISYRTRYEKELCSFRTQFQYNNPMYVLAGTVISHLANKSYEDAIQDFLNDLGMLNSTFTKSSDDFSQMPFRAKPHYVVDMKEVHNMNTDLTKRIRLAAAAGGLFIPPNDMIKYMQFHLNLGSIDGRQVVPKEVMEWLPKPSNMLPAYSFKQSDEQPILNQFGYGLGLFLGAYDGWQLNHHAGYFVPYSSQMSLYPAKKLGIFSSTNMGPTIINQLVLHAFIFETLKGSDQATAVEKAMQVKVQIDAEKAEKSDIATEEFKSIFAPLFKIMMLLILLESMEVVAEASEVEVYETFNEGRNRTEYYLEYGRWYEGWLEPVQDTQNVFKLNLETDVIQDNYAEGDLEGLNFVSFENGTLKFFVINGNNGGITVVARFELGLRSDLLPPVPWSPDSCGPETE